MLQRGTSTASDMTLGHYIIALAGEIFDGGDGLNHDMEVRSTSFHAARSSWTVRVLAKVTVGSQTIGV